MLNLDKTAILAAQHNRNAQAQAFIQLIHHAYPIFSDRLEAFTEVAGKLIVRGEQDFNCREAKVRLKIGYRNVPGVNCGVGFWLDFTRLPSGNFSVTHEKFCEFSCDTEIVSIPDAETLVDKFEWFHGTRVSSAFQAVVLKDAKHLSLSSQLSADDL